MTEQAKSYSQMRREFYENYQRKIVPMVKQFDNQRKFKLVIAGIGSAFFSILGLLCLFLLFAGNIARNSVEENYLELALGLMFLLAFGVWYSIEKQFENTIKEKIMPIVCGCYGNMCWSNGSYNGEKMFSASCVVPDFTSSYYDDIFAGSHKGVEFEIVEALYKKEFGKKGSVVFNGVIIKLAMNKNFTSHTVVKPDSLLHVSPSKNLKHTVLEDVVFEKKFDVFTNDEIEARYLITPSFMKRLNNIKTAFEAIDVSCAFYDKYLLVGLRCNQDLFSVGSLLEPVDDSKQYFQMYEEIVSIIKLIDHFKLDRKIGL